MRNLHLGLYTPNQGVPKHSGSLFHSTRATTEKKKILEEEFGVAMNEELEREVLVMCNLSQGVKAEGREEGINIGEIHKSEDQVLVDRFSTETRAMMRKSAHQETAQPVPCQMINCFCMYSDYTPLTLEEWVECDQRRRDKADR